MKKTPEILESTQPLLYETDSEYPEYPYAYAGSCFPVRWKEHLFIISAYHCYENHGIDPEKTLYPIPSCPESFFGFCEVLRFAEDLDANNQKHCDQIALKVHSRDSTALRSVNALDLSIAKNSISLSDNIPRDVWLRGFLFDNPAHHICYEKNKIYQQAYVTNGYVSSRVYHSNKYCHMVKVKTPTYKNFSPQGMSGSAVYCEDIHGNIRFGGTVIEYNEMTCEFMVIDALILCELLCAQ